MDFWIGRELVHHSVTMVQILRAVGLMAAIITEEAEMLIQIVTAILTTLRSNNFQKVE